MVQYTTSIHIKAEPCNAPDELFPRCPLPKLIGFQQNYPSGPLYGLHTLPDYLRQIPAPSSVEDFLCFCGKVLELLETLVALNDEG